MKDALSPFNLAKEDKESLYHCPRVSIGMPTYNGGGKIQKAVMSVLMQKYPDLELIISDNCSTDNTMELCVELAKENQSIRYFRQPHNIGLMPNFEFVLSQASGDLFMWMSDDDALEPGIILKYVDFLVNNPDYALVSGQIKYWIGDQPIFCEHNFNFEQKWGAIRAVNLYFKVVYGSIFYGLMQRKIAQQIPLRNRIGDDWHFISSVAFLGKIKNLHCIGYHKRCGGISRNFKQYGKTLDASSFAVRFPHIKIAFDAFSNILYHSPVYAHQNYPMKMILALFSFLSIILNYYGTQYPFILGGRIKRLVGLKTSQDRFHTA